MQMTSCNHITNAPQINRITPNSRHRKSLHWRYFIHGRLYYSISLPSMGNTDLTFHRFQFGGMLSTLSPSCLRNGNDFRPLTGQLTNSQQSGATPRTMCKGLGNGMESGRRPPETLRHKVKPTHPHGPDRLNWEIAETDDMRRDPDDRSPS